MANISIGTLFGTIELEDKLSPALNLAGQNMAAAGKSFNDTGRAMSQVGRDLLPLTAGIVALGAGSLKLAVEFESSFAGVKKTVDGITDEFGDLNAKGLEVQEGIIGLSRVIPATTTELNAIAESAGQLGIKADAIVGFTETIAGMGEATNFASEEAAVMMAQFANITQMEQSNENFNRLASTIVGLGNAGASTEKQIGEFALRIAGAGEVGKFTEANIVAIGAAFADVGVNAEAGGTAIQKTMFEMTKAATLGGEKLTLFAKTAGVSAAEFQRVFEADPGKAFALFTQGLGREGIGATTTLKELGLGGSQLARSFISVAAGGDKLHQTIEAGNRLWEEQNALTTEVQRRYATTESQLVILWNEVRNLGRELGVALLPILKDVMEGFRDFIPYIQGAVNWFKELSPEGQKAIVMFAGLVAAAAPVLMFIGSLVSAVGGIITAFGGLSTAAGAVIGFFTALTPVGWAVAAAVAAIGLAWANWDTIVDVSKRIYEGVKSWLLDGFNSIVQGVKDKIDAITGFFGNMYDAVVGHSFVPDMVRGISREMANLEGGMVQPAKNATTQTKEAFRSLNEVLEKFSGREVIERGLEMAAVITHLGGVTALTKGEQDQANVAIQAAIDKYAALGVAAPEQLTIVAEALGLTSAQIKALQAANDAMAASVISAANRMGEENARVFANQRRLAEETASAQLEQLQRVTEMNAATAEIQRGLQFDTAEHGIKELERLGATAEDVAHMEIELARWRTDAAIEEANREFEQRVAAIDRTTTTGALEYEAMAAHHRAKVAEMRADMLREEETKRAAILTTEVDWQASLSRLADSLGNLGDIGIGVIGNITRSVGTLVGAFDTATSAWTSLTNGMKAFSGGGISGILSGISSVASGIGGWVSAAMAAYEAIKGVVDFVGGLFGGGEEGTDVNPNRDRFFSQYGGLEGLGGQLEGAGLNGDAANSLIADLYNADSRSEFNDAQAAITDVIGGNTFRTGTPGLRPVDFGDASLAVLHGRETVVPEGDEAAFASQYGFTRNSQEARNMLHSLIRMEALLRDMPVNTATMIRDHLQIGMRTRVS